ncbi:MAG: hypothetical protein SGJ05_05585 [bacterium]|nr:hypothetical protein [bacterium]
MTVAISDSPLLSPLTMHAEDVCARLGWKLLRVTEAKAADMLLKNFADLALVSPLGYGLGVGRVDYRLVPGACVMLNNYTNVAGINFRESLEIIETCESATPEDFLSIMGSIVLAEKFDLDVVLTKSGTSSTGSDSSVDYVRDGQVAALDVSEEWWDLTELPLPVAVWACRIEADIDKIPEAVEAMCSQGLVPHMIDEAVTLGELPRQGSIIYKWDADTEKALMSTLEMLFYHQYVPELPAIKLLGRD